jgi:hypothetical protein
MDHTADLDTLYDQSWDRAINQNNLLGSQRARCILMWTTCATTPLTVRATGEALAASGLGTNEPPLTGAEIVSCCAGLVRIERLASRLSGHSRDGHTDDWCDSVVELEILPGSTASHCQDYHVVVFSHLSAHHYFERRQQAYFPYADDTILAALISTTDANTVTTALGYHYTLVAKYRTSEPHDVESTMF